MSRSEFKSAEALASKRVDALTDFLSHPVPDWLAKFGPEAGMPRKTSKTLVLQPSSKNRIKQNLRCCPDGGRFSKYSMRKPLIVFGRFVFVGVVCSLLRLRLLPGIAGQRSS